MWEYPSLALSSVVRNAASYVISVQNKINSFFHHQVRIAQEVCGHDYVLESEGGERLHISSLHTLFFFRCVPVKSPLKSTGATEKDALCRALHDHFLTYETK